MVSQVLRVLKYRPLHFFQYVRTHLLFQRTRFFLPLLQAIGYFPKNIWIGKSVRFQRIHSLRAELPDSKIIVGNRSIIYENAYIEAFGEGLIEIGECSVIGDARICSRGKIIIGKRLLTSWNVMIQDFESHPLDPGLRGKQVAGICGIPPGIPDWKFPVSPIEIGDDVWLGANVTILKGAKIGSGCVVAANSVVVQGDWPANSVLAGAPAKVVKSL